jgi:hypothetical protein
LVNDYEALGSPVATLRVRGLSVVNGAQTTGAVGSLKVAPDDRAQVPARFVKTSNSQIVQDIVQYNNSQNRVTASDFRSTDRTQKRLREEMSRIVGAEYEGGRRGGHADVIKRRPNLMPSYTVGQSVAALHGDPATAYNKKSDIWASDALYAKYFSDDTSAAHLVFAYSLVRAIESRKLSLIDRSKRTDDLKSTEEKELAYYRHRGAVHVFAAAIGGSLETLLGRKIPNLFRVSFGTVGPGKAETLWAPIISATSSLNIHLLSAVNGGMSADTTKKALEIFSSLVEATSAANDSLYANFRARVQVS